MPILLCLAKLPRSSFFYYLNQDKHKDAKYCEEITALFTNSTEDTAITVALRAKGYDINHKKVQRLMQQLGLKGKCKQKKYRS